MTAELTALAVAALVQFAQLGVFGYYVRRQGNLAYQASNRDAPPPHTGKAARAQRAMANHAENLILFAIAILVVTVGDEATAFTATCAWLFLAGRVLYLPAYLYGWVPGRSVVWGVSYGATLLMALAALI